VSACVEPTVPSGWDVCLRALTPRCPAGGDFLPLRLPAACLAAAAPACCCRCCFHVTSQRASNDGQQVQTKVATSKEVWTILLAAQCWKADSRLIAGVLGGCLRDLCALCAIFRPAPYVCVFLRLTLQSGRACVPNAVATRVFLCVFSFARRCKAGGPVSPMPSLLI
jgi:hypothetical protein